MKKILLILMLLVITGFIFAEGTSEMEITLADLMNHDYTRIPAVIDEHPESQATPIRQLSDDIAAALDSATQSNFEFAFPESVFQEISSDTVYKGALDVILYDGIVAAETSALFVCDENALSPYETAEKYLTSPRFIESIRPTFKLVSDDDAELVQSFLYLVDGNYSSEGFFNDGNTWYFIREEFFGDVEVWIFETNKEGKILSLSYTYSEMDDLPELRGNTTPLYKVPLYDTMQIPENLTQQMHHFLEQNLSYTLEVQPIENSVLQNISTGVWNRVLFSTEEYDKDGSVHSSTLTMHVFQIDDRTYLFGSIDAALGDPVILKAISPTFKLDSEEQALQFELALDVLLMDESYEKSHFLQGNTWYFIRSNWFGEGIGFIVDITDQGKIVSIEYSNSIPYETGEILFDTSNVE
ncbi:MAG: hypothetical protein ACQ5SW_04870 [Sphaerochaetaceae bacterium]